MVNGGIRLSPFAQAHNEERQPKGRCFVMNTMQNNLKENKVLFRQANQANRFAAAVIWTYTEVHYTV